MPFIALTIAGSDPSGGAGIQADLKTFHQRGVYGTAVITLLTVQNTLQVKQVECVSADLVAAQLEAVLEDVPPAAAKTGALGNGPIIRVIAERARNFDFPLVVDPVMVSKHGARLLDGEAISLLRDRLLPHAFLTTPNIEEAAILADMEVTDPQTMEAAVRRIARCGVQAVLIKGGHLAGPAEDLLFWKGDCLRYSSPRMDSRHTHGTGCTYSAAITAELAKGRELPYAVTVAKKYITAAIRSGPEIGHGIGPVNHQAVIEED